MRKINVVRTTDHPVVKLYIDIIQKSCETAGYSSPNVSHEPGKLDRNDYFLTDSPLVAIQYILRGYKNHIVWFQGVSPEESYLANKSCLRYAVLSWIEKIVLKRAKVVFCVSEMMKAHYEKKYRLDLSEKCIIMPCFNETEITQDAFSEEKYRQNSFVYVGGLHVWQCFEETAKLYAEIEKRACVPTKFYVYTAAKEDATQVLLKHGVQNFAVDYVDQDKLSQCIKGMKYGFVLREDCVVNNVATPTKLSNYLANGIIPIYSPALKSFAEFDKEANIGVPCALGSLDRGAEAVLEHMGQQTVCAEMKKKCAYAFATYYNKNNYIRCIAKRLHEIMREE